MARNKGHAARARPHIKLAIDRSGGIFAARSIFQSRCRIIDQNAFLAQSPLRGRIWSPEKSECSWQVRISKRHTSQNVSEVRNRLLPQTHRCCRLESAGGSDA